MLGKMFEMWAICVKRFCSNLPQQVLELDSYNFDKTELAQLEKKSRTRSCGSRLQLCWNLQSEQYNTRQSISVEPDLSGVWACGGWSWCVGDLEGVEMVGMMHVRPRADAPPNSSSQGCPRRWPNGQSAVQNTQQNWSSLIWIKMKTTNTKYWFKPQGCLG